MLKQIPGGGARMFTWVASGYTVETLWFALYTGSETLVSSAIGVSSGAGHYYAIVTMPSTPGYYQGIWNAYYDTDNAGADALWKEGIVVEVVNLEVD